MKLIYHKNFKKHYKARIEPHYLLEKKFISRLKLFIKNPKNPLLKDHKLTGKKSEYRSFSITGDIRVVYKQLKNEIWLYDIGSHNQVY